VIELDIVTMLACIEQQYRALTMIAPGHNGASDNLLMNEFVLSQLSCYRKKIGPAVATKRVETVGPISQCIE